MQEPFNNWYPGIEVGQFFKVIHEVHVRPVKLKCFFKGLCFIVERFTPKEY